MRPGGVRRGARRLLIYAVLVLLVASCRAWQVHSAPFDCADDAGHGPNPGSECEGAIASARERRPEDTLYAFIGIVLLGGLGRGVYGALRLSMRIESVRRFADGRRRDPDCGD